MKYRLIALDMDGTVLNDKKELTPRVAKAIHDALSRGIEVVFNSGRSLAEMEPILVDFPDMNYLLGASGALVYDLKAEKALYLDVIPTGVIARIREAVKDRDIIYHVFSEGRSYFQRGHETQLASHLMKPYAETLPTLSCYVEDVFEEIFKKGMPTEKFNIYHTSPAERDRSREILADLFEQAEIVNSEEASLETTAEGVNKGNGIVRLAEHLGIPVEATVMIGDADNDLAGLKAAGLAIGMGNCNANVRAAADRIVADNNHDGCAEAIEQLIREWDEADGE